MTDAYSMFILKHATTYYIIHTNITYQYISSQRRNTKKTRWCKLLPSNFLFSVVLQNAWKPSTASLAIRQINLLHNHHNVQSMTEEFKIIKTIINLRQKNSPIHQIILWPFSLFTKHSKNLKVFIHQHLIRKLEPQLLQW